MSREVMMLAIKRRRRNKELLELNRKDYMRDYQKKYYAKHREEILAKKQEWYANLSKDKKKEFIKKSNLKK